MTVQVDTELGFSYEYGLDIYDEVKAEWLPFRFPTGINPQVALVTVEAATYDDLGSPNQAKTSESWTADFTVQQHRKSNGSYLEEVELLLSYTKPDVVGNAASARFRWYDKPAAGTANSDDAYEGYATVTVNRAQTGNSDVGAWSVTLTGKGRRKQITNPWTGWGDGEGEGEGESE